MLSGVFFIDNLCVDPVVVLGSVLTLTAYDKSYRHTWNMESNTFHLTSDKTGRLQNRPGGFTEARVYHLQQRYHHQQISSFNIIIDQI